MNHKRVRVMIVAVAAFIAISAIAGGAAMLAGAVQFPLEWLRSTPFSDYTIPALTLAIVAGGSALLATVMVFTSRTAGVFAAMAAGLIMAGYEVVEVITIMQVNWLQGVYFGAGLVVFGLAAFLWVIEVRRHPVHSRRYSQA